MEKRLKRIELGLVVGIVLIAINLGYNIYQGSNILEGNSHKISNVVSLPDDLTEKSMGRILKKIKEDYST